MVREQPRQRPLAGSMMQTPMQGEREAIVTMGLQPGSVLRNGQAAADRTERPAVRLHNPFTTSCISNDEMQVNCRDPTPDFVSPLRARERPSGRQPSPARAPVM